MLTCTLKSSGIYKIVNLINGKSYVGSAANIYERIRLHRKRLNRGVHHSPHLQAAWSKYGEEVFEVAVLELVAAVADLYRREQVWLDALQAVTHGYNVNPCAEGSRGVKRGPRPPEVRAKIAAAHRGVKLSEEHRLRIAAAHLGIKRGPMSAQHKMQIGLANKGRKPKYDHTGRPSPHRGRVHTAEAKENIRLGQLKKASPTGETRKKMSEAQCRRAKFSEETRRKMSESATLAWAKRKERENAAREE